MSPVRVLIVCIAAVAAIGLALVMRSAFGGKETTAPIAAAPEKPTTRVLVAKRDLAVGERVQIADLGWQDWPAEALNPAFITDGAAPTPPSEKPNGAVKAAAAAGEVIGGAGPLQAWQGALVREPILNGEPVMTRKLVRDGDGGFMSVVLSPGKRAVSVPVNVETGAGGFILPGDRVDVLQSREMDVGEAIGALAQPKNVFVTDTVLTNVRVLAIDQNTEAAKGAKSMIGSTATLEVGPTDAEVLMRAKSQGALVLALRPIEESGAYSGATGRDAGNPSQSNMVRIHRAGRTEIVGVPQ